MGCLPYGQNFATYGPTKKYKNSGPYDGDRMTGPVRRTSILRSIGITTKAEIAAKVYFTGPSFSKLLHSKTYEQYCVSLEILQHHV